MMSKKRVIEILTEYQLWRRGEIPYQVGGEKLNISPFEISTAIDLAIQYLQEKE